MNKRVTRTRRDYLDIAKAIAIFLVIIGHATSNTASPTYRCILYTFHMPLFFMVSGIVTRKHQTTKYDATHYIEFLKNNFISLLIPYFIWALIFSRFNFTNLLYIIYGSWQTLGKAETLTSLWFLPCLSIARILMELILHFSNNFKQINRHLYAFVFACISFVIGFKLPSLSNGYPFCFNVALIALGFMLLGYSFKEYLDTVQKNNSFILYLILFISLGLFIVSLSNRTKVDLVLMCSGNFKIPTLFLADAICGSMFILTLSCIISNIWNKTKNNKIRDCVIWLGQNTIGVFLLHKPFLRDIIILFFNKLGLSEKNFLVALLGAIITLPIICIFVNVINKYIPELFGKFREE